MSIGEIPWGLKEVNQVILTDGICNTVDYICAQEKNRSYDAGTCFVIQIYWFRCLNSLFLNSPFSAFFS